MRVWALFEKTAEEMAPGELWQLLPSLKMTTTPPPTPTKMKEEKEEGEERMEDEPGPSKRLEKPIYVKLWGTSTSTDVVTVMLPQCDQNMGWMHTSTVCTQRRPLLCMFCPFSTYNLDSLNRHKRDQHK